MKCTLADLARLEVPLRQQGRSLVGPCPWCGGDDRFRVMGDRYACRRCEDPRRPGRTRSGDTIQFLRDRYGFDFRAACDFLEIDLPAGNAQRHPTGPTPEIEPSPEWRAAVSAFLPAAQVALVAPAHGMLYPPSRGTRRQAFDFLRRRGLTPETMHARGLGFVEGGIERYYGDPASSPSSLSITAPAILIPWMVGGEVWEIKVRYLWGALRYVTATWLRPCDRTSHPCGQPHLFGADSITDGCTVILVEGEFDAILLQQEIGDLAAVCTLGSTSGVMTARAAGHLLRARRRILALDSDEAGQAATHRLRDQWPGLQFEIAPPWPGKDPGECRAAGVDLLRFTIEVIGQQETEKET